MPQDQSASLRWVSRLSQCLRELVDYEHSLEYDLSDLRWRASYALVYLGAREIRLSAGQAYPARRRLPTIAGRGCMR